MLDLAGILTKYEIRVCRKRGVEIFIKINGRLKLETPNYRYITRRHLWIAQPCTGSLSLGD